jgi:cysteine desulfurase
MDKFVYFDHNATTFMPEGVKRAMVDAMDQGNPSADYSLALKSRAIIEETKSLIANLCEIPQEEYKIIFNSGASEGNNFVFHTLAESCARPHFLIGATEHKTSLECCKSLSARGLITYELISPNSDGTTRIPYADFIPSRRPCLISVMQANNETGAINNIARISALAKKIDPHVVIHSDYVQMFGKVPPNLREMGIDVATVSFHKIYGPPQLGCVIISTRVLEKYKLCPMIAGAQNEGWRGGTENVFLIAGCCAALKYNFLHRRLKNAHLADLKRLILARLSVFHLNIYCEPTPLRKGVNLVIFGPRVGCLPNTLLFSIVHFDGAYVSTMCNLKLKKQLYAHRIIISLGSACNKGAASYVLSAMGVPKNIAQGVVRISFGDSNSYTEVIYCADVLINIIRAWVRDEARTEA